MSSAKQPTEIFLKDYQVPSHQLETTELTFKLFGEETLVEATLSCAENPDYPAARGLLVLNGHPQLELQELLLNGEPMPADHYQREGEELYLSDLPERFTLTIKTRLEPHNNTALEGLYQSDGVYYTQCEAEGFRRITFYPDRPDVMSKFTTTIEADKATNPVMLSNGNCVASEDLEGGRHRVVWEDPFKKPAYLFALVAGDLQWIEDSFVTMSGREVTLKIYAEEKDLDKLSYAMTSLKNAMRWDEEVYGREYDLDIYMIVAVDFFNMGAMENKGLNVFNTSCVLAHPATTTDVGFQRVEGVVAHEYFHNWSGNRVTCRDWFQLSLKEGFTVFRDSEFSADMNSRTVKRVEDVTLLRTLQFAEDAGPMAHPVRPESFIEISNFYTLTVYEKGCEVVRMLHTLLGKELFRQGTDLYFERHDGQAVTTDDFVKAMEEVSGRDLTQFKLWYSQAGTPVVEVEESYDSVAQVYQLTMSQSCPPTRESAEKAPMLIPVLMALLDAEGNELVPEQLLELTEATQTFRFEGIVEHPVASLFRGFSAPVKVRMALQPEQLLQQMRVDGDGFNRWNASQQLLVELIQGLMAQFKAGQSPELPSYLVDTFRSLASTETDDKAMLAAVLSLPSEAYLSELAEIVEVDLIHQAREWLKAQLGVALKSEWLRLYMENPPDEVYSPDSASIARRSLRALALDYLMATEDAEILSKAHQQYLNADNMTDQQSAFIKIAHSANRALAAEVIDDFYQRWQNESLVVNQWFTVQATRPVKDALNDVKRLLEHPAFNIKNPNRVRGLISAFCNNNPVGFHQASGEGYQFLADQIIALNKANPQIASRLLTPLTRWRKYPEANQQLMVAALRRVKDSGELSSDVFEVVDKSLQGAS